MSTGRNRVPVPVRAGFEGDPWVPEAGYPRGTCCTSVGAPLSRSISHGIPCTKASILSNEEVDAERPLDPGPEAAGAAQPRDDLSSTNHREHRRGFIAALGAVIAGAAALVPASFAALAVILDPLRQRGGDAGLVRVATLSGLPDDGVPRRYAVTSDRTDGWTRHTDTPVGSVYLVRTAGEVRALNVVCPHAGCFVGLNPDRSGFACPCHKSSFTLDGRIDDPTSPSPRDMDSLDVVVRDNGEVWVRFQNFQPGTEEKIPV